MKALDPSALRCYTVAMTKNESSGSAPQIIDYLPLMEKREKTIDAGGNIIDKPYGISRWATPKRYDCTHSECEDAATLLSPGCPGAQYAHNCCAYHKEGPQ